MLQQKAPVGRSASRTRKQRRGATPDQTRVEPAFLGCESPKPRPLGVLRGAGNPYTEPPSSFPFASSARLSHFFFRRLPQADSFPEVAS